jgi:hypothetical protein
MDNVPEEEDEENNMNETLTDKKQERTIGEQMATSNAERRREVNNDRSEPTKKKTKVTQDNIPFGHVCDNIAVEDDTPYLRIYCQNVSGIFDRDGIGVEIQLSHLRYLMSEDR